MCGYSSGGIFSSSRNLYKKTGNIWAPATLNAVLMTTMTLANTMVCFK